MRHKPEKLFKPQARALIWVLIASVAPIAVAEVTSDSDPRVEVAHKRLQTQSKDEMSAKSRPWIELFTTELWYREQTSPEREFVGVLEHAKARGQASSLQRIVHYQLGERALYTGARRLPALDKLVGYEVIVRGKAVNMHLEGELLREIWPARVRPAHQRNP